MRRRLHGALLGAGVGSLLPALAIRWITGRDPGFADDPASLFGLLVAPTLLGGLLLGLVLRGPRWAGVLGGALALAAVLLGGSAVRRADRQPTVEPILLVVALPSVTWEEASHLHAVHALAARGSFTRLGGLEGGLDDWITLDSGVNTQGRPWLGERPSADQVPVARVWDVAAWSGLSVGLFDWPVSAPARPLPHGGFVIPPGLAPSAWPASAEAMPRALRTLLRPEEASPGALSAAAELLPLGLRWSTLRDAGLYAAKRRWRAEDLDLLLDRPLIRARLERDVFLRLLRETRPDLAAVSLGAPAALARGPARMFALDQADQILAEILAALGSPSEVVLLSDTGWMVCSGPGVPLGGPLEHRVEDVAPTLLGMLGLPSARDMRGGALFGEPERRVPTWDGLAPASPEDPHRRAAAEDALRQVGYWE